ncbi:MAG: hypothetical protein SCARUB_05284 [Candidatus Scalindua rubra]|uniref:C-type cytochrome biogenesis protein CcmI n=1 Tax=Candidatus Scalindua rubra TaxID=1872076 RepID=A0A1E3X212_9BACT|nr:MAG: hypothetical protein SCARUB_05284 [Candidatus Scalindua rubra]
MFAEIMILVTFVVLVTFIVQPLFASRVVDIPDIEDNEILNLQLRKEIIYRQIKEAEMERDMGNLSDEDYNRTRRQLKEEASQIIDVLEQQRKK